MSLTGLEIFKLLPNTNCKECGFATCLAFAMRVAAKKIDAEECPYLSEEAKEKLGASAVPPIRLVEIKSRNNSVAVGDELVMFRHEKTFVNQTLIALEIADKEGADKEIVEKQIFKGDRRLVKEQAAQAALDIVIRQLEKL